jgi:CubicO group peptidase (beta-lactamase class C family)
MAKRLIRRLVTSTLMAPLLLSVPVSAAGPDKAAVDKLAQEFLKGKDYAGLVVGITRPRGHEVFGYGRVILNDKGQSPAGNTLFEIGSITKAFTGTLLADLVAAGKVRLDDPAQRYLPKEVVLPRRDDRDMTLLHLATHSSSLPVQPPDIPLFALAHGTAENPYAEYRLPDLGKTLERITLDRPIGCRFAYSNLGVGILGHALAGAAKAKDYEDLLVRRLCRPLGMVDTCIQLSGEQQQRLPPCHNKSGQKTAAWTFGCLEACGAIRSTAHDLLLFIDANLGRNKSNALAAAFKIAHDTWRDTDKPREFVGLCWLHRNSALPERHIIWHNGGTMGSRSFMGFLPKKGAGVVLLGNSSHSLDAMGFQLLELLSKEE